LCLIQFPSDLFEQILPSRVFLDSPAGAAYRPAMFPVSIRQLSLDLLLFKRKMVPVSSPRSQEDELVLHEKRIASHLSILMGGPVEVRFTDNRTTMISCRRKGALHVRLHRMFQQADDRVLNALALYLKKVSPGNCAHILDEFIARHRSEIRTVPTRRRPVSPAGAVIQLDEVLERVSNRYFGGAVGDVRIGWGKERTATRRRRRTRIHSCALATYCFEDTTIRVNPVLDSLKVPDFFIDWVVYHELLHHVLPVERSAGRTRYHDARFRSMERAFARHDDARRWEADNISWLVK